MCVFTEGDPSEVPLGWVIKGIQMIKRGGGCKVCGSIQLKEVAWKMDFPNPEEFKGILKVDMVKHAQNNCVGYCRADGTSTGTKSERLA